MPTRSDNSKWKITATTLSPKVDGHLELTPEAAGYFGNLKVSGDITGTSDNGGIVGNNIHKGGTGQNVCAIFQMRNQDVACTYNAGISVLIDNNIAPSIASVCFAGLNVGANPVNYLLYGFSGSFIDGINLSGITISNADIVLQNGETIKNTTNGIIEFDGTVKTPTFQMTNGATSGYFLQSDASGNASWVFVAPGSGAPTDATYVTLTSNGTLTNERILTGTTNQINLTDYGAGASIVLSFSKKNNNNP